MDILNFKNDLVDTLNKISKTSLEEVTEIDVYRAIGVMLQNHIGEDWTNTHK